MLTKYIQAAMKRATYELEDDVFYGEIPGVQGVYSETDTLEACREELQEVLEDWILFRVAKGLALPEVDGLQLVVQPSI